MAIKTLVESKKVGLNTIISGRAYNEKTPTDIKLVYEINKNRHLITFYPNSKYYFFDKITISGFSNLPPILHTNGYSKNKILDYIHRIFKDKNIKTIGIIRTGRSSIVKRGRDKHLRISYNLLRQLCDELGSTNFSHRKRKSFIVSKYFHSEFPKLIKSKSAKSTHEEIQQTIQTLSLQSLSNFEKEDINKITDILSSLMKSGHRSQISKSELFKNTKLKIDTVTLDEVIMAFEKKLKSNTSESEWGRFLENNLFLIDSKYIHSISQFNLVLGGSRKVDFGLVDIQGYLDIFEIKKPDTPLISLRKDTRGNFIWSKQAIEAIVQAEKYLLHAVSKRSILKDDIKRERQIVLDVIRPRAFVLIGSISQLDSEEKRDDFQMLRNQFKNVDIILYDELLERIKNQKKSIEQ